ncbi:MAG: hypothetical protein Q8R04_02175 [Nanoarchaeota archaeon]|nr:hypothetical protein [Nanoarchaeota archaeon]
MPTINIKPTTKELLYGIMSHELQKQIQANPKTAMRELAKNKFGINFDFIIFKVAQEYKRNHRIT